MHGKQDEIQEVSHPPIPGQIRRAVFFSNALILYMDGVSVPLEFKLLPQMV